ncbi:ribosome small subunit-dependent GTPase A [Flavobacteriales bacterium]|jgi:ribosome biogenesis GTPase|nr:ribosome small subunit-dependent GTPase A [Flavobacteriales bacterium]MDB2317556.1 ribosome small subunit-dependent GTPase A [Flavobacteriales bacterium]MDB2622520.1 ribosome small subunit-dependent GTPase A [Flavobacteriales bacterium]
MQGVVVKSTGSWYRVRSHDGNYFKCRIKGKFRIQGLKSTNPISVGDQVKLSLEGEDYLITEILDRRNYIIRKSVNLSKQVHIIASNMDQAFLIITLASPATTIGFIDRFLVTAEAYQIPVYLVFNKIDLYDEFDREYHDQIAEMYTNAGYKCIEVSALNQQNLKSLTELMKDKVTLLSGHSGVGKSTLVNAIDSNLNLETQQVSEAHQKGMHTTTFAEMFELAFGGFIIDTPGIKGLGLVEMEDSELADYFPEMRALKGKCKFHNCMHINEPKCAIKDAVEAGLIHPVRYDSYLTILEDDGGQYRESKYH